MKPFIAFTHDEAYRLLAETVKHADTRCHVLFLLCIKHGLRVTEALNLTKGNFTTAGDKLFIYVSRLKRSLETTQECTGDGEPLFDERTIVTQYLTSLQGESLFDLSRSGADWLMKRYAWRAGIPAHKRSMHKCKHTTGTWLRKAGADVVQIQNALGHADIRSTMAYMRPSAEEVEQARITALTFKPLAFAAAR